MKYLYLVGYSLGLIRNADQNQVNTETKSKNKSKTNIKTNTETKTKTKTKTETKRTRPKLVLNTLFHMDDLYVGFAEN